MSPFRWSKFGGYLLAGLPILLPDGVTGNTPDSESPDRLRIMKRCPACGEVKPFQEFPVARRRRDGRASICLVCKRQMDKRYYKGNPEWFRERNQHRTDQNKRKLVEYLRRHPCVDCGEANILVLEFDHRDGKPKNYPTNMIWQRTWNTVLKEIQKCDVRCSNCHTIITRIRAKDWRISFPG